MAGELLFVPQTTLVAWTDQGRVSLEGSTMAIGEGEEAGRRYAIRPAARFLRVVGGDSDPHGLLARVKTHEQLRAMGAEAMADSVLFGEVAYEVEPGFVAEVVERTVVPPERRKDAEALARFLLDNLP